VIPERGRARRLPRARRITRGAEIRSLFRRGKRSRTPHLDVLHTAAPVAFSRAGLVVPRHRHTAVDRNRLKRRLREIVRLDVLPWLDQGDGPADVLLRARPEAYRATYDELRTEVVAWLADRFPRAP